MTFTAIINGQPAEIVIPDGALTPPLAVKRRQAAKMLSIGLTKLDILIGLGKVEKTNYGTIPVASINAHLSAETSKGKR